MFQKKFFIGATWQKAVTRKNVPSQSSRFYVSPPNTSTSWTDVLFGFGLGLLFGTITR